MINRRALLKGVLAAGICLAAFSPAPVLAQSGTTVITLEEYAPGKFRLPSGFTQNIDAGRQAAIMQASEKALKIAQRDALSVGKANGVLSKLVRPLVKLRTLGSTLFRDLLAVGLIAGLTWALSDGSIVTDPGGQGQMERADSSCRTPSNYPLVPGSITSTGTGMYRNSASTTVTAYSRQVVQTTGGTAGAPSGWSWVYQRNIQTLGNGQYLTEAWFSRNVTSANCQDFKYPVASPVNPSTLIPPGSELPQQALDQLADKLAQIGAPDPLPAIPSGAPIEDPGPVAPSPGLSAPWPGASVPAENWDTAFSPAPTLGDPVFKFPDGAYNPGTGEGEPGGGEGSGGLPDFTVPSLPGFPDVTPIDWWPNPFTPPVLNVQCVDPSGSLASLGDVTIPLCRVVDLMAPVLRPLVAGVGLIGAGKIILDI